MSWSFNPFTGNLDLVGGGGTVVFEGEVETFADLPETVGDPAVGASFLVRSSTGVWLVNRRQAGIWIRRNNTGVRATDWEYGGDYPVNSVNGQTGNVSLTAADVGASATGHTHAAADVTSGTFNNARINFAAPAAIGNTTPAAGTFTTLAANNGTITASAPVLDLSQTWNNAAVTFTGLRLNVTNTASNAASKPFDFQIGGTSVLETNAVGLTTIRRLGASTFANALEVRRDSSLVFSVRDDGAIAAGNGVSSNAAAASSIHPSQGVMMCAPLPVRWTDSSTSAFAGTTDLQLFRDGSHVLAQRTGTNPQTFRIYNTFTDASNHERGFMRWSGAGGTLQIGTEALGTGSARALELQTGGTTRFTIATNGAITCSSSLSVVGQILFQGNANIAGNIGSGIIRLNNQNSNGFDRLQFGGGTTSFPALKRDSTVLQARLANDSDFCPLQGQLRIHQNAVSETITATHTLTLYDAAGTAYKVPCVAA